MTDSILSPDSWEEDPTLKKVTRHLSVMGKIHTCNPQGKLGEMALLALEVNTHIKRIVLEVTKSQFS